MITWTGDQYDRDRPQDGELHYRTVAEGTVTGEEKRDEITFLNGIVQSLKGMDRVDRILSGIAVFGVVMLLFFIGAYFVWDNSRRARCSAANGEWSSSAGVCFRRGITIQLP